jgi:hypothetical protein
MTVHSRHVDMHEHFELKAEHSKHPRRLEVEDLRELFLKQECNHEPEGVLLMLLEMDQCSSSYKVHALSVAQLLLVSIWWLVTRNCLEDLHEFS